MDSFRFQSDCNPFIDISGELNKTTDIFNVIIIKFGAYGKTVTSICGESYNIFFKKTHENIWLISFEYIKFLNFLFITILTILSSIVILTFSIHLKPLKFVKLLVFSIYNIISFIFIRFKSYIKLSPEPEPSPSFPPPPSFSPPPPPTPTCPPPPYGAEPPTYDELYEETDKLYEKKQSESITYSNLFKTSSLAAASYVMEKYMEGFCFKCNSKVKVNNYLNNCIECQSEFVELYH